MTKPVELYRPGLTGCTDHGCIIQKREGMGTNGGCNCERELQRVKPHGFNAVLTISYLRQQLGAAQTKLAQCEADARRLKSIGRKLSNVAFNLKQMPGRELTNHDCEQIGLLQNEWDAAIQQSGAMLAREGDGNASN